SGEGADKGRRERGWTQFGPVPPVVGAFRAPGADSDKGDKGDAKAADTAVLPVPAPTGGRGRGLGRTAVAGLVLAAVALGGGVAGAFVATALQSDGDTTDRKSTRLNSSHVKISYAVFCLKTRH